MGALRLSIVDKDNVEQLVDIISQLHSLEAEGRDASSQLQLKESKEGEEGLTVFPKSWAGYAEEVISDIINSKDVSIDQSDLPFLYRLRNAFSAYAKNYNDLKRYEDLLKIIKREPSFAKLVNIEEMKPVSAKNDIDMALYELDRAAERSSLGGKCTWLHGELPLEDYSLSAITNDLTSCLHTVLSSINASMADHKASERCYMHEGADRSLVDTCVMWDKTHKKLLPKYYRPVYGVVEDGVLEIKMGVHHGVIDKNSNKMKFYDPDALEWGDTDRARVVEAVFKNLCKVDEPQCTLKKDKYLLECSPVIGCEKAAATALASADVLPEDVSKSIENILNIVGDTR